MRKQLVSATQKTMANLLLTALHEQGLTQGELARKAGVTSKHVNLVLNGQAGAQQGMLDYWAWLLGLRFEVTLAPLAPDE